jgi:CDP-glucose 4,6-dehydratase
MRLGRNGRIRFLKIMSNNFWKDRQVLVTGFEGFLGSNLAKTLLSLKARVTGLDIAVRRKETLFSGDDYKKISVIKGSVADYPLLKEVIYKHKISVVFHLAAEAIVGKCLSNPLSTFSSNIEGTWKLLEACRVSKGIQSIVVASSDKAYGSHKDLPYIENTPLVGDHPYDVSKSCADLIAYTYAHTYNLPVAITRCGNIYGPGDFNFSRLIPDAIRCILSGKTLKIRSDGKFVRDYVYVGDVVSGYLKIAELSRKKNLTGESFNLSDECPLTVIELLQRINKLDLIGRKLSYRILNTAEYEIEKQYLSSAKARRVLGWKPEFDLTRGLRTTAEWYLSYFSK